MVSYPHANKLLHHIEKWSRTPIYYTTEPTRSPPKSPRLTSRDKNCFTVYEDHELNKELNKYGKNNWTSILRDSDLHFAKGRTTDTLTKRVQSEAFSLNTKGMRPLIKLV